MKINKRYQGWRLERLSVDKEIFTLTLISPAAQQSSATVVFSSVKKSILSKVSAGAEISQIREGDDDEGHAIYIVEFSPDSFIEISANTLIDLPSGTT